MNGLNNKPLMTDVPKTTKITKKTLHDSVETLNQSLREAESKNTFPDFAEFSNKKTLINNVPLFLSHDSFKLKKTDSERFLAQKSLGKKLEDHIIQKIKKNDDDTNSENNNEEDNDAKSNNSSTSKKSEAQLGDSTKRLRGSKQIGEAQLKILEEQIKEKEKLMSTIKEKRSQKTRVSFFVFHVDNPLRKRLMRFAESK